MPGEFVKACHTSGTPISVNQKWLLIDAAQKNRFRLYSRANSLASLVSLGGFSLVMASDFFMVGWIAWCGLALGFGALVVQVLCLIGRLYEFRLLKTSIHTNAAQAAEQGAANA